MAGTPGASSGYTSSKRYAIDTMLSLQVEIRCAGIFLERKIDHGSNLGLGTIEESRGSDMQQK